MNKKDFIAYALNNHLKINMKLIKLIKYYSNLNLKK